MEGPLDIRDVFPPIGGAEWRARVDDLDAMTTVVDEGVEHRPIYFREDAEGGAAVGVPGVAPYVRGTRADAAAWTVQQRYRHPCAEHAGDAAVDDLEGGADAVWLELGAGAVQVATLEDVAALVSKIDRAHVDVQLETGADFLAMAGAYLAVARRDGVPLADLQGGYGADPITTLLREGSLPQGLRGARLELVDLAALSSQRTPKMRACLVSGVTYADARLGPVKQIAYSVATALTYLRWIVAHTNLDMAAAARQLRFAMGVDSSFFSEIAKLRALRWVYAKMLAAHDVDEPMDLHVTTAARAVSARDPYGNLVRGSSATVSAVFGGANRIAVRRFDERVRQADEPARRFARNTQLVLREEASLHRVVDPAGGSWFVERLTESLARAAWEELREIERSGGLIEAIRTGRVAGAGRAAVLDQEKREAIRQVRVVGVTDFASLDEEPLPRDKDVSRAEAESRLGRNTNPIDPEAVHRALVMLASSMRAPVGGGAVSEAAIEVIAAGGDVASVSDVLRIHRAALYTVPLAPVRPAAAWEALRTASDRFFTSREARPRVFVGGVGPRREWAGRATYLASLLNAAGIEARFSEHDDLDETVASAEGDRVAFALSSDARASEAGGLAGRLKNVGVNMVFALGSPDEPADAIDGYVKEGDDVLTLMRRLHRLLGVTA